MSLSEDKDYIRLLSLDELDELREKLEQLNLTNSDEYKIIIEEIGTR